jgi:hypothetical protein
MLKASAIPTADSTELTCDGPHYAIEAAAIGAAALGVVLPPDIVADLRRYAETFAVDTPQTSEFYRDWNAQVRNVIAAAVEVTNAAGDRSEYGW